MKICSICKNEKSLEEYNKHAKKPDGLQTICKACSRERSKAYYKNNNSYHKKAVLKRNKIVSTRNRAWLFEYLLKNPCVDCGNKDVRVLEFDHVSGIKKGGVARLVSNACSLETIQKEIDKCEVRCRNCHQIKTFERMGGTWHDVFLEELMGR